MTQTADDWGAVWRSAEWQRAEALFNTLVQWKRVCGERGIVPPAELQARLELYRSRKDGIAQIIIDKARRA